MKLLTDGETEGLRPALTASEEGVLAILSENFKPDEEVICQVCHACTTITEGNRYKYALAQYSSDTAHVMPVPRRMGLEDLIRHVKSK